MFLISVEWLDEAKTRARFNLPGREAWRAEHIDGAAAPRPALSHRAARILRRLGWLPFLLPSAQRQRIAASFREQEVQWRLIHTEERRD